MRKLILLMALAIGILLPVKVQAQSQEIQQLVLNIEKLSQFKGILKDMKKGYDILSGGYNAVRDLSQGNFTLHKTFLDALFQVSPLVRNYKKVGDIITFQVLLVKESKAAFTRYSKSGSFTSQEMNYFEKVYDNLLGQSLRNLDELLMILSANTLRMSDDERLQAIDKIYAQMEDKLFFVRNFNASSNVLALQRARESSDIGSILGIHGLKN
ncbi:TerB family tellurite resistance protein [Flavobacterium bizetiae]|uniref:TerB family tellurite resistance protein n=1 Tax=Flavobacterium bizetiae TaxID=2704140 RepID=UPI00375656C7